MTITINLIPMLEILSIPNHMNWALPPQTKPDATACVSSKRLQGSTVDVVVVVSAVNRSG